MGSRSRFIGKGQVELDHKVKSMPNGVKKNCSKTQWPRKECSSSTLTQLSIQLTSKSSRKSSKLKLCTKSNKSWNHLTIWSKWMKSFDYRESLRWCKRPRRKLVLNLMKRQKGSKLIQRSTWAILSKTKINLRITQKTKYSVCIKK